MNIITWNVNRFDGTWDWYAKECDLEQEKRTLFINNIIEKIGEFIVTENDIAVLQEVPYKETIKSLFKKKDKDKNSKKDEGSNIIDGRVVREQDMDKTMLETFGTCPSIKYYDPTQKDCEYTEEY